MNRALGLAALVLAAASMARADGSLAAPQLPHAELASAQQAKDAAALSRPEAHAMLRAACKADGASPAMQYLLGAAARLFGPRW